MNLDINKLFKKYLTLDIPNPFTLEQINNRFKNCYFAEEVDIHYFSDLEKDPHANFDTVVKAYIFRDERGIKELLKLNPDEYLECYHPNGINIILNSEDKTYLSGATEQGMSFLLGLETSIFCGISQEDMALGNEKFEDYLKALYLAGYIQFEDDPLIERAYQRYRDGYTLKWYGLTDGESTF
ncbi:pyruvate kinase [Paenibacillus apiarius]|uniref:pyruvate kinase n=1 Tax=Paenibacillus apiarius TaxID=46240 RepID=UPI00197FEB29|nr:pyruvate kinase [Paenibacillus apiarius]MBN3526326.1 pyruvate kinase [Paenibacillus apiarius]